MAAPDPQQFVTGWLSDVGQVRQVNQDSAGEFTDAATGRRLLIVADGMGGHQGGEVASRTTVETVGATLERGGSDPALLLRQALENANQRVHEAAQHDTDLTGMGTTGVCLLFEPAGRGWVGHVGDSRAYRLRNGRLEQITEDHSVVGALIRMGQITEEEARSHPQRHEILRAIGTNDEVEVQVTQLQVDPGDRYLLCSDGLTNEVSDAEITDVISRMPPEDACRILVQMANLAGGSDNVTVSIAAIPGESPLEATLPIAAPEPSPGVPLWMWGAGAAVLFGVALLLLAAL